MYLAVGLVMRINRLIAMAAKVTMLHARQVKYKAATMEQILSGKGQPLRLKRATELNGEAVQVSRSAVAKLTTNALVRVWSFLHKITARITMMFPMKPNTPTRQMTLPIMNLWVTSSRLNSELLSVVVVSKKTPDVMFVVKSLSIGLASVRALSGVDMEEVTIVECS